MRKMRFTCVGPKTLPPSVDGPVVVLATAIQVDERPQRHKPRDAGPGDNQNPLEGEPVTPALVASAERTAGKAAVGSALVLQRIQSILACRGHLGLAATDVAKLLEAVEEAGHVGARIYTIGSHLAGAGVLATRACSPQAQEKKETYGDHGREIGGEVHGAAEVIEWSVAPVLSGSSGD